jgi:DNA-binding CsgD family transcriptional regulator
MTDKEPNVGIDYTAREGEVLKLIVNGLTSECITKMLNVSIRTVDKHRGHLLEKYHAANTVELTRFSLYLGYIGVENFHFFREGDGQVTSSK